MTKKFSEYNRTTAYDLPEIIDPERICVCLEIPNEKYHIRAFFSALYKLSLWNSWEADDAHTGTLVASVWRDVWNIAIGDQNTVGCGCEGKRIIRQFYDENGNLLVEYDDETTEARPDLDVRVTSPVFPELPGENDDAKKCAAAESIVKTIDDDFIQAMEETNTSTQLLGLLIAMLALFLSAGTLAPLVMGLVFAILSFGIAATKSAFTPEVLEQFRCILYNRILPDNSFDNAAWLLVKSDIMSTFTGIVQTLLFNTVNAAGEVGLTNMARSGKAASGDCDSCDDEWCYFFDFAVNDGGFTPVLGFWNSGCCWEGAAAGGGTAIYATKAGISHLTKIEAFYSYGTSGDADFYVDGVSVGAVTNQFSGIKTWNVDLDFAEVGINPSSGAAYPAPRTCECLWLRLTGTGENPFGSDNCD